jgi:glycosyltransferase involved in cell wall biosynthesis
LINAVRSTPEQEGPWMRRVDRWSCRRVTCFLALSEKLARELAARLAIAAGRVRAIANGVDLDAADRSLAAARPTARQVFGLLPTDIALAGVGRLHPQKGLGHLLEAFRSLLQLQPTARLLLAGDGPERAALEATVRTFGLRDVVRFLGTISDPWPLFAAADVFVMSSLWEGMPNVLLEAMTAGLPSVTTAVGAIPEMVESGRESLVVPPANAGALAQALAALAAAPERRRRMGALARQRVESAYRIETTVAQTMRLYDELLAKRSRAE